MRKKLIVLSYYFYRDNEQSINITLKDYKNLLDDSVYCHKAKVTIAKNIEKLRKNAEEIKNLKNKLRCKRKQSEVSKNTKFISYIAP